MYAAPYREDDLTKKNFLLSSPEPVAKENK